MPNLSLGIVGLPNVGKSTLFNALTGAGAAAENYPFCTVDPNVGVVPVPDRRLDVLYDRVDSRAKVPADVTFVDIAGLVEGASRGEGLGNQFLANIRDVHAIVHLVRCFDDPDVAHVLGSIDPVRDREIIELELALADLDTVERRLERVEKTARSGDRDAKSEAVLLERLRARLARGEPARAIRPVTDAETAFLRSYNLLTAKRVLYVANVGLDDLPTGENRYTEALRASLDADSDATDSLVPLSVRIEAEMLELEPDARSAFLHELGLEEPGLARLIRAGYRLLGLISFFTTNEKEVHAWTVPRGTRAPRAAGEVHSDFEKGFIRAETIAWDDFERVGSLKAARDRGLVRSEGKDYVVEDGDIMLFRSSL